MTLLDSTIAEREVEYIGKSEHFPLETLLRQLLGDNIYWTRFLGEDESRRWNVLENTLGRMTIHGSVVAPSLSNREIVRRDPSSENRALSAIRLLFGSWKDSYFAGEIHPEQLSNEGFWTKTLMLLMKGPNADIFGDQTVDSLEGLPLLKQTMVSGLDDCRRLGDELLLSVISGGGLAYLHLDQRGNREHGGLNIFVKCPTNGWQQATNWREWQQKGVIDRNEGVLQIITPGMIGRMEPLRKQVLPQTKGEWWQQAARGVRAIVMSGRRRDDLPKIDWSTWLLDSSVKEDWTMRNHTEVLGNLIVAYWQRPKEVIELLVTLGWPKEKLEELPDEPSEIVGWLKQQSGKYPEWEEVLTKGEYQLGWLEESGVDAPARLTHMAQLAPLVSAFSLLSPGEVIERVTPPDKREKVVRVR